MPGGPPSMPPTKAEAPVTSAPLPECPTAAFMPFTVARCLSSAITSSVRIGISPSPSPAKGVLVTSWPLQLRLNLAAKWIWVEQPQVLKYKQEMLSLSILGKLSLTVIAEGYWNCQRDLRLDQKKKWVYDKFRDSTGSNSSVHCFWAIPMCAQHHTQLREKEIFTLPQLADYKWQTCQVSSHCPNFYHKSVNYFHIWVLLPVLLQV